MAVKFIVDINAGKLVKWLRLMGYDALLFRGQDDGEMVKTALREDRVILTRDTHILKRRVATTGKLKVILVEGDTSEAQLKQVVDALDLDYAYQPFSRCLECNELLVERSKEDLRDRVPPHVFKTQTHYMECPSCHRIYWQGTHWQAMTEELNRFAGKDKGRG
jgi:uncharacterized protein with PIN domain